MNWLEHTDEEILKIIEPIMSSLMDASTQRDHAVHVKDFTEYLKSIVTKEELERQCNIYQEELGHFSSRQLLGIIKRSGDVRVFWRQWYTKTNEQYLAFIHVKQINTEFKVINVSVS